MFPLGSNALSTLHTRQHWHADLFRITRRDGIVRRFTSTGGRILFGGQVYVPTPGERKDVAIEAQLSAGDGEVAGLLHPDYIAAHDVQAGRYDDALVEYFLADWKRGKTYLEQHFYVDKIQIDGPLWRAQLLSLSRELRQNRGPVHRGLCSAVLGDDRCTKIVTPDSVTVTAVQDPQLEFDVSGHFGQGNWYAFGAITWTSGNNVGTTQRVFGNTGAGRVALAVPTRFFVRAGDTAQLRPGCDGQASTCKNKHGNLANFRGNERQRSSKALILARGTVS